MLIGSNLALGFAEINEANIELLMNIGQGNQKRRAYTNDKVNFVNKFKQFQIGIYLLIHNYYVFKHFGALKFCNVVVLVTYLQMIEQV